jgi:HlyD family secretion protein
MNERVVAGAAEESPDKPVRFPLEPPISPKPSRRRSRRGLVLAMLALLVVAAAAFAWTNLRSGETARYVTAAVSRGPVIRTVTATGTVNPELTIIVGTYVSGVIQELFCDYNTRVKKGQICAKIDPRPYQTVVDQAKANLAVAQAQQEKDRAHLAYTKLRYERTARLMQTSATSQDAVDLAKSNYEQALAQIVFNEATIQQRQAALDAALVNVDYTNIISPVDGVVVSRNVTVGQTVAASFQTPTLFLIATDLTKMEVNTNVSESDIGDIKIGDEGTFTVDAFPKRTFAGKVTQVRQSPQTVQNVVTYDVIVSVGNVDLALKPGMTASVRILLDQRADVLRVPSQALRYVPSDVGGGSARRPDGATGARRPDRASGRPAPSGADADAPTSVFVLRNGRPEAVPVRIGLENDSFAEIVSGDLKPGDEVVTGEQSAPSKRPVTPRFRF